MLPTQNGQTEILNIMNRQAQKNGAHKLRVGAEAGS